MDIRAITHIARLTYPAFYLKIWSFSVKAKYASCVRIPRPLSGFPGSFFAALECHGGKKVLPVGWLVSGFWLQAFANFAFFAAPKLPHSPTLNSPHFLQAFGGLVASQTRR